MADEKKKPSKLPEILWHEPVQPNGFFEFSVPIPWEDFKGTTDLKGVAVAILNIVGAIKTEYGSRGGTKSMVMGPIPAKLIAKTAEPKKTKAEADEEEKDRRAAAISNIIADEPSAVAKKRKEYGKDIVDDVQAAAIIYAERSKPPQKPADIPKTAEQKAAAAGDYVPPELADADYGKLVRFYKSEYGWSAYLDNDKEDAIPILFDWLISIPIEMRHRKKSTKYPVISHSGKYIMCNSFEKEFIATALTSKGLDTTIKED